MTDQPIERVRLMVYDDHTRHQAAALMFGLPTGKRYSVTVAPWQHKRSLEQNSRLWWLHSLTAAHLGMKGLGVWTEERVHYRIFVPRYCRTERRIMVLGKETFEDVTSSELGVSEFMNCLDRYQADMINEGIEIPAGGPRAQAA